MKERNFDVILVGGGVMGCAIACYLLKANNKLKVALIEMDPTYARSSTTLSDGNTRVQFNIKENIQMSMYGLEVLERFGEEMAVGENKPEIAFRRQGDLFLVDEEGRRVAKQGLHLQRSLGCRVEWLSPGEIKLRYPLLSVDRVAGGTFGMDDGTMDPHAVLMGYKNKSVSLGADFIKGQVIEMLKREKRMTGVRLASGEILGAGHVVNTAGAWAKRLAQSVGVTLPVEPVKRQVFVISTNYCSETVIPLIVFPTGLYLIHEHEGVFMVGKSFADDPIGLDDFDWHHRQFEEKLWPELFEYIPDFDRLKVIRGWAGLYAVNTFDGNAILGEWPEIKGLYLANGFSGHGFQQCHAVGRYISELILDCKPILDLAIFSPRRILENKPVFESTHKLV